MEIEKHSGEGTENLSCEIWKPIQGYEGLYEVSNFGRVRSLGRRFEQRHYSGIMARHYSEPRIMKQQKQANGYLTIGLCDADGIQKRTFAHRLVAAAFLEKPEGKDYINHLDANPQNNRVENLEWCSQSGNIKYAYDHGTKIPPHIKKYVQYDMDGNFIRTWDSRAEIERSLNIPGTNITKVCKGKRNHAGGFKWQFM